MTRILIQRGSASSSTSSSQNKTSTSGTGSNVSSSAASTQQHPTSIAHSGPAVKDENLVVEQEQNVVDDVSECGGISDKEFREMKSETISPVIINNDLNEDDKKSFCSAKVCNEDGISSDETLVKGSNRLTLVEEETDSIVGSSFQIVIGSSPPPPPVPPPKPSSENSSSRRFISCDSNAVWIGPSRRAAGWPGISSRSSPTGSHPSSPRSHCDGEGYNSADEQNSCFSSSYDDTKSEHQFEIDIRRVKGFEVRKMLEDGNCLFRAVADQVYGDSELHDLVRQMCIDYMERERDHFSQFLTEGFTTYCKRKRRDKVYGNNMEIQALSEMYNRPIHIYSYITEPINIFHGSYNTDIPPIRLSYHHGNHYNSLVDPRRLTIGAGLGFSSLQGRNIDKDQIKAAIKAQQDQQIDNALVAEGRFYSDLELTEKEIERMVMEASRIEYNADDKFRQQLSRKESSTSIAEPSSSAARPSRSNARHDGGSLIESGLSNSVQIMLSMGFSYLQVMEASSIFGDDVDSMVCYLIETNGSSRRKGKATE